MRTSTLPCAEQALGAAHNLIISFILILPKLFIAFFPYTPSYHRKYNKLLFIKVTPYNCKKMGKLSA
jgi:hypothetical protein